MSGEDGHIHIYRGTNARYAAVVRARGRRTNTVVQTWTKSKIKAHRALMKAMLETHWKTGNLLWITDYYDPISILEVRRP